MPLPLLAAGALVPLAVGAAQAVTGGLKSEFDRRNEEEAARLRKLQGLGEFGLTAQEERIAHQGLIQPVKAAAQYAQSRAEATQASAGNVSGAALSSLRQETSRGIGEAQQRAALTVQQQDVAKQRAQKAELAQREAASEAARKERRASVFEGLSQAAAAGGSLLGAVPEVTRAAGLAGAPIRDTTALADALNRAGVPAEDQLALLAMPSASLTRILDEAQRGILTSPEHQIMYRILQRGQGTP